MRTNIVLDDVLVERALTLTGMKTKRAVIDEALRTLILLHEQEEVRQLRGQLHWEGDIDATRLARTSDPIPCC
jgi:Arc/MetJ family transcription regulator